MVTSVIDILKADDTVVELVGLNTTDQKPKIYPVLAPQKEKFPYIIVRQTEAVRSGKNCNFDGSYRVWSYHRSFDDVTKLNDAIVAALEAGANEGISFSNLSGIADDYDFKADGDGLYCKISTFDCNYEQASST
jgi:hypothetical protein